MDGTEAITIARKWNKAVVDGAARMPNCDAINDNNPHFSQRGWVGGIFVEAETLLAVMAKLRLTI
jgi:hypothetical protein